MSVDEKSLYAPCDTMQYECVKFGADQQELVRVDSYIQGADALKQDAIRRNSFAVADSFYPGVRMAISDAYIVGLVRNFQGLIRDFFNLDLRKIKSAASKYSIVTSKPEDLKLMQRMPHFDAPSRDSLAVIHYLCDAADSGTAFYHHGETGYDYIDRSRLGNYEASIVNRLQDPARQPSGYICGSTKDYSQITSYGAAYNRLLMYRGSSLHSGIIGPNYNFDPSPETGRLTVTSFIEFS
ncbi:hypothetical protein GB2207_09906 [marine gamma proteobacterium HTCC2207]|jgi:hypothetical protein|uniref:Uncharacterized protein n=1 Tax=gamma proteobacterium HTCC2207 TaxID=314287 RepID=Q1YUE2_9GAMM|nr:hypothetical protein GB2207_09906 [marine gamma proteobacterium HTCC2207] [gamma proteobacterium HTCC2207]MBT5106655.1 hypothetical protein [Porticoccaceae bacterium]MDC3261064.1 DUF6445 family protein [bacterium]MBT6116113.1 hypothetical protein [Porticoccaceae bacterium]MBT6593559.1 hypothetical protein [Porticoccaceae bacterium]